MTDSVTNDKTYFKLGAVVDHALEVDLRLSVAHYFRRYLASAKWYYSQLAVNHACHDVKTVLLDVSDTLTVTLPADCVRATKVGIPYGQYIVTLAVNADLSKIDRTLGNPEFVTSGPPGQLPNGINIENYGGYWFMNHGGRALFSVGGGLPNRGFYTIVDRADGCKEMLLDEGVDSSQIYVEYITSGVNPCGETILNPNTAEAVRRHLIHFYHKSKTGRDRDQSAIILSGRELWDAEQIVKASRNDLDPETLVIITRKYYRLTSKI